MIETTITLRKLTASEGCVLTNGETSGPEIYLAVNDSAENWHEITEAEYALIEAKRQVFDGESNALEPEMEVGA